MLTITSRNVNHALPSGILHLNSSGEEISPRGIRTLEYPTPVCTTYLNPCERVLFSEHRDANPFFHFMEALWILAGRNDVAWLSQFNARMTDYSDDGMTFNAPYGYRLRYEFGRDQIEDAITVLKRDPHSRQAVMVLWNPNKDLGSCSKDIPCNDMVFLKIRDEALHMTVCCRSNDMLWGAYGANVVQFSTLLEYMAACLGVEVGVYRQISDSFHVYLDGPGGDAWHRVQEESLSVVDHYKYARPFPLVRNLSYWNTELRVFFTDPMMYGFQEPYFKDVAVPMLRAWNEFKTGDRGLALDMCRSIEALDWRKACYEWIERRIK